MAASLTGEPHLAWRTIDWGSHVRDADVGGRTIHHIDIGRGSPVVLIHGAGGSWRDWLCNIPALAYEHRVIALDLPGMGGSDRLRGLPSAGAFSLAVSALLDHLRIGRAAVVGNSFGGLVAAHLAGTSPQRTTHLVLVAAGGLWSGLFVERRLLMIGAALLSIPPLRRAVAARLPAMRDAVGRRVTHAPHEIPVDVAEAIVAGELTAGVPPALLAAATARLEPVLTEITCPTLVLWGAQDRITPPLHADLFVRHIPTARCQIWPDTGHVLMVERPRQFNDAVARFLAEPDLFGPSGQ